MLWHLDISETCAGAAEDRTIIRREVFEVCSEIALLNDHEPTHTRGGVLDLPFVSAVLTKKIRWSVDQTVTSSHFEITVTLLRL